MFKRILQSLFGASTIPVCIAVSISLYAQLSQVRIISYYSQRLFLIGAVAYLILHAVFFKPAYLYILGHELMHVIATWISGGRVTSFRVSPKGGSVGTTKSNAFIALAPYFFPFYTLIAVALYSLIPFFINTGTTGTVNSVLLFLFGFTLTFHIVLTVDFLKIRQTDLLHTGYFFSICLIYIVNIIIIALIFSFIFSSVTFIEFLQNAYFRSLDIYKGIYKQLFL
jgi:hypothetical protein